ncbi:MAG TPA: pyruvate carboxylase [Magnetospirillaceae bacterium]|jgi:pyruvate carboxylase
MNAAVARPHTHKIKKLLVANRSEIAIRVFRAAAELGIDTVAIYSREDRYALHRFKANESYLLSQDKGPIEAYLDIPTIIRIAKQAGCDAIHPGYGFLSENPDFAQACIEAKIIFVGPAPDMMRSLGNKVQARALAEEAKVPVMPATGPLPEDPTAALAEANRIGFPVMLKASWGGGGRGMRTIRTAEEMPDLVNAARREAKAAFGNDEVYLEKLVERARHVEVQILGDTHGNLVHLFERDCSVQRRNQKVVERAPAPQLNQAQRTELCEAALRLARKVGYRNAGTAEFLYDADTGKAYFIEVNPRIQVEHTVTEMVTGIDIVKAQIRIAEGAAIGSPESGVPKQDDIKLNGNAIQCRITTEDPNNNFIPDYGRLTAYRGANGFGIRLDGGTAYSGALVTRYYDSLLEKVTAWAPTAEEAIARLDRALREFRIAGIATNLAFLEAVLDHPKFKDGSYTTRFIDTTPELFQAPQRRDRASRLLTFIADVIVNGNPQVKGRPQPRVLRAPHRPENLPYAVPPGTRQLLNEMGPKGFADWMLKQTKVLVTDTTFRDAHQSLIATRLRTRDMLQIAPVYARLLPQLLSLECWGGATFDVTMRFLQEDPWERLEHMREAVPNILFQMLLRASNAVGYTNYPDNVVKFFVERAAKGGVDVFRVFDSLNWVDNMRVAMDAVLETGKLCEAAICYTGDLGNPNRPKYNLKYYVDLAKELEKAGAHILGIKDMAGLCKPHAARQLVTVLKQEVGIPIHFHTHDTSGISAASALEAVEAGVDAIDAAMDSFSGCTSQPSLGSICAALRYGKRDPNLDPATLAQIDRYWAEVRDNYVAFESEVRPGSSDVYHHEMPGGQYTNLLEQARSLGIEDRWSEVCSVYADVNQMFGDIVKVTPTSKVVGDMALMMVTSGLSTQDVLNPGKEIAFPESVVSLLRGDLGQPPGGFPAAIQKKALKNDPPITVRPGAVMAPTDLEAERAKAEKKVGRQVDDDDLASWLMYPKVFADYAARRRVWGDVSILPTPVYFYGMQPGDEIAAEMEQGKTLLIRYLAVSDADDSGHRTVFFELNGQARNIKIPDRAIAPTRTPNPKAEEGNANHIGAPMPGVVTAIRVQTGQKVEKGDALLSLEAMKMETTVFAERTALVAKVVATPGMQVDTKDLLVELQP